MTLLEIKTAAAAYHEKAVADLTQLSLDLGLVALNQSKQTAQLGHDFNFQRKMLTLTVNSVTGASLASAVIQGTATAADIKTIVNIGVFDEQGNFRPVPWTTAEEGQERMLKENRYWQMPWGGRDEQCSPYGTGRFVVRNGSVFLWPIGNDPAFSVSIGIEAFVFDADWDASHLATPTSDVWTTKGSQYLLWSTVIHLNKLFKSYVPRQEGNLSEPQALADAGLASLILWDDYKVEQFRTHGR